MASSPTKLKEEAQRSSISSVNSVGKDEFHLKANSESKNNIRNDDLRDAVDENPRFVDFFFRRKRLQPADLNAIATRRSVFDDPVLAKHYWPTERYENLQRFDPDARWTFAEEQVGTWDCL